jgi:hypothetical protein
MRIDLRNDVHHEEDSREAPPEEQMQKEAAAAAFYRKKRLVWNCIRVFLLLLTAYLFSRHFR